MLLVYNAVPKSASLPLAHLINLLSTPNNFSFHFEFHAPNERPVSAPTAQLHALQPPAAFVSHMAFTRHAPPGTAWIQLVREPVARMQSLYYYLQSQTDAYSRTYMTAANITERTADARCGCLGMPFDECVQRRAARNCSLTVDTQLGFFCEGGRADLAEALANLQQGYRLVGLAEAFEDSVVGFERVLPQFFRGAGALLRDPANAYLLHGHRTVPSPSVVRPLQGRGSALAGACVSMETRRILADLATNYAEESAFYDEAARLFFKRSGGLASDATLLMGQRSCSRAAVLTS